MWMAEATTENKVVRTVGIAAHAPDSPHMIQSQVIPHAPRDVVIRARRVAAHSDAANDFFARGVETQPSAKNIHAAGLVPYHGIIRGSVMNRRSLVSGARIHGIAELQTKQTAAGLHRRVEVGGRQR